MAPDWTRRHLIYGSAGMAASGFMQGKTTDAESDSPALHIPPRDSSGAGVLRAVVIGHTGAGNYGHGLDQVFCEIPGVEMAAVADEDEAGREETREKIGAERSYAEFDEMLAKEKPDLVCIAPRWTGERFPMAMAALQAGAHILVENPFTQTLAEADELLAVAEQQGRKIAVAHPMLTDPHVEKFYEQSRRHIGELLEMRVYGKMDDRAGGEDLLVQGSHLFDLVRLFGGEAEWCTARIRSGGHEATLADVKQSRHEDLGPILGDDISAQIAMDSGVNVTFTSRTGLRDAVGPWGIEFIGSRSVMRLQAGEQATFSYLQSPDPRAHTRDEQWKRWPDEEPYHEDFNGATGRHAANRILVTDWLDAIAGEEESDPKCSGYRAMKTLEMIHGIWQAGLTGERVKFPLVDREHPLASEEL
ncbi:MAG: Gfo/Idh/MocA family oxidoreductase [Verrucomicrobiales bacterium]|nr:Gfo/Idh/MocA family oxidoreductase [Verrucomicrobiales bacterium]